MKKLPQVLRRVIKIYNESRLPTGASALSFKITMTFFPILICLYTLLGSSREKLETILEFSGSFLTEDTVRLFDGFIDYIASNNSPAMMAAGIIVLITTAAAAFRSLQSTIGAMQGGTRYRVVWQYIFSFLFSLIFLLTIYLAVLVMFTGKRFITFINGYIPFFDISESWNEIRFAVFGVISLLAVWGIFEISKRNTDSYSTFWGSLFTTVALTVACRLFSIFFAKSANYPLVYGSFASLVLLMVWLYYCCLVIYVGAAINIAIRDIEIEVNLENIEKARQERQEHIHDKDHISFSDKKK